MIGGDRGNILTTAGRLQGVTKRLLFAGVQSDSTSEEWMEFIELPSFTEAIKEADAEESLRDLQLELAMLYRKSVRDTLSHDQKVTLRRVAASLKVEP